MKILLLFALLALSLMAVENLEDQKEIEELSKKYLGGKYVWGGNTPDGFDCSGYTKYIFAKKGIKLPRTAYEQSKVGDLVVDDFKKGDLLFFNTDTSRDLPITHVGVYLENGKFIHAANKKEGVIISPFSKYEKTFVTAKRILGSNNPSIETDFFMIALKSDTKVNFSYGGFKLINGIYQQN
jgi:hypothetical protein